MAAKQQKSVRLSEVAMLVHLRLNTWGAKQKDKSTSGEVARRKKADEDVVDVFTHLVSRKDIAPIKTARSRCRALHYHLTLPYLDGGLRILPTKRFMEYRDKMHTALDELHAVVDGFAQHDYPRIVKEAPKRMGDLAVGVTFPSPEEVKQRFATRFEIFPVPETQDFRCKMGADERKEVEDQVRQSIGSGLATAMKAVWENLFELIADIQKTMADSGKTFRDSKIGKLREFVALLPTLNMVNDPDLNRMATEANKRLGKLDPDVLRKDKGKRKAAADDAADIVKRMKSFMK